ncbi:ABC transporter permease [Puniceicoccaceae bacterium K14]|nr:ABC transporter permease [Puniceicoccaceae bacterium K14]
MFSYFRKLRVDVEESVRIAIDQLLAHKFRSLLTALGVIIGIWAVILIGVGINGIDNGFTNSMNMLGPNSFFVERWPWQDVGDDWRKYRKRPLINTDYATELNEIILDTPNSLLQVAVPTNWTGRSVSYEDQTARSISILGTNSDFGYINTADTLHGRFFTAAESTSAQCVVVIGSGVADALFPDQGEKAIGKKVKISKRSFEVIGVLERQGKFLGMQNFDNQVIMPLTTKAKFVSARHRWMNSTIRVAKYEDADREQARDEIIGAMRRIRNLSPEEENDFEVNSTDIIEEQIGPVKTKIAIGGFLITGLSLFVGAIGIMNITFVSVNERTKEIGTRRAIGARRRSILIQFLFEAASICLLGGATGLFLAYLSKIALTKLLPEFPASLSIDLMIWAVVISVTTGVLSGFIPALKASNMDPATALRHD